MRIAMVGSLAAPLTADDRRLADGLRAAGADIVEVAWDGPDGVGSAEGASAPSSGQPAAAGLPEVVLGVVRATPADPDERERLLAWASAAARDVPLLPAVEVLRWNTHRSYLLELEDRGAPVVPTAWLGRGDDVPLAELLEARGWSDVELLPAVGPHGAARVDGGAAGLTVEAGQHHLDALLAHDDALVRLRPASLTRSGSWTVVLVDGEVSHAVRTLPAEGSGGPAAVGPVVATALDGPELDAELARLAGWVLEATAVEGLTLAAVELVADDSGIPQLVALDAVAPELHLGVRPAAARRVAEALMRVAG